MAYVDVATVRQVLGVDDEVAFPELSVSDAIAMVERLIDQYVGTSFEYRTHELTLRGIGLAGVETGVLYPRTVESVTVDGEAVDAGHVEALALHPHGLIMRTDGGVFAPGRYGPNVEVRLTAGKTETAPPEIRYATQMWAADYLRSPQDRFPSSAISVSNELGVMRLSTPGRLYPSGLPEVDAILIRARERAPLIA